MNRSIYISLILCLYLFLSCESELDTSDFDVEQQMVVICLFNPGEHWKLSVRSSERIFDPSDKIEAILNATVKLVDNDDGQQYFFNEIGEGNYEIKELFPKAGISYSIEVNHKDYPAIKAKDSVPALFSELVNESRIGTKNGIDVLEISTSFKDALTQEDRVIISHFYQEKYKGDGLDTIVIKENAWLECDDKTIVEILNPGNELSEKLFLHNLYGKSTIEMRSYSGFKTNIDPTFINGSAELNIWGVSHSFYQYILSNERLKINKELSVTSIIAPVDLFSNIEGGLGIFAGYNKYFYHYEY